MNINHQNHYLFEGSESHTRVSINSSYSIGIMCTSINQLNNLYLSIENATKACRGEILKALESPSNKTHDKISSKLKQHLTSVKNSIGENVSFTIVLVLKIHYIAFSSGADSLYLLQNDCLVPLFSSSSSNIDHEIRIRSNIPICENDRIIMVSRNFLNFCSNVKMKHIFANNILADIKSDIRNEIDSISRSKIAICVFSPDKKKRLTHNYHGWAVTERFDIVKKSQYFANLSYDELLTLMSIHKTIQIEDGTRFISQGSDNRDLYFILDGKCKITKNGQSKELQILDRGAVIGDFGALSKRKRSANVISVGLTYLLSIEYNDLVKVFEDHIGIKAKIYEAGFNSAIKLLEKKEEEIEWLNKQLTPESDTTQT